MNNFMLWVQIVILYFLILVLNQRIIKLEDKEK